MVGTFYSGAKVLPDIIDEIADKLIAEGWSEGDATWDTTDRSNNVDNARRCLKYTGDAQDIWIALECVNYRRKVHSSNYYAKGMRVTFSSSWDSTNHTYGTTNSQTFVGFENRSQASPDADMASLQINYFCWVDATGFALMGRPEVNSVDGLQTSFICVVEHLGSKEYSDGLTNFYCYNKQNYDGWWNTGAETYGHMHPVIRPFAYESWDTDGIQFWADQWRAFKSTGNGKVYYMKPLIFNDEAETMPIFQSELFFGFSENSGLVDGDVVAMDGLSTKYLCKSLDSPNNTTRLNYAIKYIP